MNNNFAHLIFIPVTGVGIRPFRGQEWYAYRLNILKQYTLKSLLNQTNRRFVLWLGFRPQEKDNPLTKELAEYLKQKGIFTVMTFTGLPYWDDKFNSGWKEKIMNLARIIRMAYQDNSPQEVRTLGSFIKMILTNKLPLSFPWRQSLKELFKDKNKTLKDRLAVALSSIQEAIKGDFQWVFVSRIDSDDMFHQDFIQEIQSYPPFPGALTCRNGYVYNSNTNQLAEWNPGTHPPFHTIIFPKETFFDSARYLQYFRGFKSHEDVPTVFNSQNLKDRKYCVLIHQKHISTIWEHPWKGKEIEGEEKVKILQQFLGGGEKKESLQIQERLVKLDLKHFPSDFELHIGIPEAKAQEILIDDQEAIKFARSLVGEYLKHPTIPNSFVRIMNGLKFYIGFQDTKEKEGQAMNELIQNFVLSGDYEPETTKLFEEIVKEGDVCVDVGASIGYFTMVLARKVGESGKVIAIEPTKNQIAFIAENTKLNGFENRVELYRGGASDKTESIKLHVNAGSQDQLLDCVALDDILPEKVDFIKIDVDGSEPKVLKGLIKTIERNPQLKMVIEYYPKCMRELGNDPDEMMAILDKYFTHKKIEHDNTEEYYNLICTRK